MSAPKKAILEPPAAGELLDLVAQFLSEEIRPLIADEKLSFRVRVAANVLQIAKREFEGADALLIDADGYLVTREILHSAGSLRNLTNELLQGARTVEDRAVFEMLRRYVDEKLRVAAPNALTNGMG